MTPPGDRWLLRSLEDPSEYAGLASVRAASAVRDGVDPDSLQERIPTVEEIAEDVDALDDPTRDLRVAEFGGNVVGYSTVRWWPEQDGTHVYLHRGYVKPEAWGQGVGSALVTWAEDLIRELAHDHGTSDSAVFGANASETERDSTRLLLDAGYAPVLTIVEMGIEDPTEISGLGNHEVPEGVSIREPTPGEHRHMWEVQFESYAHWPSFVGVPTEEGFQEFSRSLIASCCRVAESDGHMIGMMVGLPRSSYGEVKELSVLQPWRRRGIGRALLLAGIEALRVAGCNGVRLSTNAHNPDRSYALYESVGFRRLKEFVRYRKPVAG